MRLSHYKGAGVLLFHKKGDRHQVLLARRKRSGRWSIPGGGMSKRKGDTEFHITAIRELKEEFGTCPELEDILDNISEKNAISFPVWPFFSWKTFYLEMETIPDLIIFPDRRSQGFRCEFSDANWFDVDDLPEKLHFLMGITISRLKTILQQKVGEDK